MTPLERAEQARHLLQNPTLKAAFEEIRQGLVAKLEEVPMGDVDTHHEVAISLQLLKRLKTQLQRYIDDQAIDKHKQKQATFIEKMRERYTA